MKRLFIISNNLPVQVEIEDGIKTIEPTIGDFTAGLDLFYDKYISTWIGKNGLYADDLKQNVKEETDNLLAQKRCKSIYLSRDLNEKFEEGFCNNTLWPLFHYFLQNTSYYKENWNAYKQVNEYYANIIAEMANEDDLVWIHDYHLLLLPRFIRERIPNISIGFFLHIPFPSFEIFRLLPWRTELLEGILGADLIGFHTYDYERHFMSCVRRLLGYDNYFNRIRLEDRIVKLDAFPRSINFGNIQQLSVKIKNEKDEGKHLIIKQIFEFTRNKHIKTILSIDRLDYSKGIDERLKSYELFLETYPEYLEKVSLLLFVVPSRENVEDYMSLKKRLDELVGRINGKYGVFNWMPIWYFYRVLDFEEMVELYGTVDIALITPVRDGMNLIAKEFIASRTDNTGVLILSEMAGAAKEMGEAILVNPNNRTEVAEAILFALNMPHEEQIERNLLLQKRIKSYDIIKWANDFMEGLSSVKKMQEKKAAQQVNKTISSQIYRSYTESKQRMIFLDYDGTLTGFHKDPQMAKPNEELYSIIDQLLADKKNTVVIISGRDKETLTNWFSHFKSLAFIAEHGVWNRNPNEDWKMTERIDKGWMEIVKPILEDYTVRTPRTFIETKNYSLVWHYRDADPDLGTLRSWELKDDLKILVTNLNLEIMDGDKVIEIKNSGVNKGRAALSKMGNNQYDFILAMGDDWTDEYTFSAMPDNAFTIKVGRKNTQAKYFVEDVPDVRNLLKKFINHSE